MILADINAATDWAVAVAAFCGAFTAITGATVRIYRRGALLVRDTIREEISPLAAEVQLVKAQMYANGGMTLRDAVNRIESRQSHIEGEVEAVLRMVTPNHQTEENT